MAGHTIQRTQLTQPTSFSTSNTSAQERSMLYNTIRRLAIRLLERLNQRLACQPTRTRINAILGRQNQNPRGNLPTISYAAVTVLGLQPSGVVLDQPAPVRTLMQNMHEQNRLRVPRPLQGTTRILITHSVSTMLRNEARSDMLSEALVDLISLARKPSTFKKHAGYFLSWVKYAQSKGLQLLPIPPMGFANYLMAAAQEDNTASPTISRCDAASFFSDLSNTTSPMQHSLCRTIKEAIKRRLGIRGKKKLPLLHEQVSAIITRQLQQSHTLYTVVTCFRIATMYEGCLRWHDLSQLKFGDIIITKTFLRIFISQAKTDAYRKGQWVTLAATTNRFSAYTLLAQVLDTLALLWTRASEEMRRTFLRLPHALATPKFLPLSDIPLIFYIDQKSQTPDFTACTQYPQFLHTLQEWAAVEGLVKQDIGTHSLRRGLASDWALVGIPDRLRRSQGRWKSEIVADGYIDESINIQMQLRACHYAKQRHAQDQPERAPSNARKTARNAHNPDQEGRRKSQRSSKQPARIDL